MNFGWTQSSPRILNQDFEKKLQTLLSHDVPEISCEELHHTYDEFILLDTREWKEYSVSHLKNAKWVGYQSFDMGILKSLPKSAKIVCYCSVGYRSERIAKRLIASGYTNVYNLYGSIFEWINRGYLVYDTSAHEVRQVHGYNKKWSRWVSNKQFYAVY
ncbi:MAG: rhodanese-like domain-containing protein [Saprospiraceae bacterium]|nr:rhodanese-like domain-containing protein [Saprospiraceae bacterium]